MDYEFLRDITGVVKVRMSMGHEVVGHWFNEEVKENLALLDEVEDAARTLKGSERSWQRAGHEYTLWMDGEEVMVRANQLEFAGDEMEEGMNYYDEESLSLCGVEDFLQVVAAIWFASRGLGAIPSAARSATCLRYSSSTTVLLALIVIVRQAILFTLL